MTIISNLEKSLKPRKKAVLGTSDASKTKVNMVPDYTPQEGESYESQYARLTDPVIGAQIAATDAAKAQAAAQAAADKAAADKAAADIIDKKAGVRHEGILAQHLNAEQIAALNAKVNRGGYVPPEVQSLQRSQEKTDFKHGAEVAARQTALASDLASKQRNQMQPLLNQVGVLNPEQQAIANPSIAGGNLPEEKLDLNILGQNIAEKTAIGAAGGAALGSVVPGAGTLLGAGLGALGGAVSGTVTGTFAMFSHRAEEKADFVNQNTDRAKYNIKQAILLTNKGGDTSISLEGFNNAVAELRLAEARYKELSKDPYEWKTHIREKQVALNDYMTNVLPMMINRMQISMLKPDPSYIDNGLDEGGNPL